MSNNSSLDSLLAEAAASDYESTNSDRHTSSLIQVLAVVSAIILALVFGAAIVQKNQQADENSSVHQALVNRIKLADKRVATAEQDAKDASKELANAESAQLAGTDLGVQAQKRLDALRQIAGFTPLSGGGIDVLLDDAKSDSSTPADAIAPGRVQDHDIQSVVNGLWTAGAKGIAINGRRLTSTSAIRNAGDAILVDYRPLVPPYHVVAVADNADATAGIFRDGVAGLLLEQLASKYGVVWNLTLLGETTVPAAPGIYSSQGSGQ